jgi:hypothetical protein
MTFQHDLLPGEPIMLVTLFEDFNFATDLPHSTGATFKLLESVNEPVFLIDDLQRVDIALDDLTTAASITSRGDNPLYHHPKIREVLFVTSYETTRMAIRGLTTDTFGNVRARLFDTLGEALAYARSKY